MAKIVLNTVSGGYDLSVINENFNKIAEEFQNDVLYRDNPEGEVNTLESDIDINGKRLCNLAEPINGNEAARLQDITNALAGGAANLISFTPSESISANTVQGAIQELDDETQAAFAGVASDLQDFKDELISTDGSSLIGFSHAETYPLGTVGRALQFEINVKNAPYNALGNGVNDDTAEIQAAINACPPGGIVYLPPGGDYIITAPLVINKGMTLRGSTQYQTAIIAIGCSGLLIDFTSQVQIHNLEIAASVRYTTVPNAFVGIDVTGSTGTRPFNHIYRDVLVDGFSIGHRSAWLWSAKFSNFRTNSCNIGIKSSNLSANNVVTSCEFSGAQGGAGSRGIQLLSANSGGEGWMISDTLIDDCEIGIEGAGYTHVFINNCIIDHNRSNAILIGDDGVDFGGNWTVKGCYLAAVGASGDAIVKGTNSIASSQNRGNIIIDNQILAYSGSTCLRGIYMIGTQAINNIIKGNIVKGFSAQDIRTDIGKNIITDNQCQSGMANSIYADGVDNILSNNIGPILFQEFVSYMPLGQNRVTWSFSIPTSGTWTQGDIAYKSNAAASGFIGWVCTAGGTPGTWKTFGAISA